MTTYCDFVVTLTDWRAAGCPDDGTFDRLEAMRADLAPRMQATAFRRHGIPGMATNDPETAAATLGLYASDPKVAHIVWCAGMAQ